MAAIDFAELKQKVNKSGKLVFDIETTGKTANDRFVAIGYMWKRQNGNVVNGHFALSLLSDEEQYQLYLGDLSWFDIWRRKGFEIRCFTEFWHTRGKESLLETLSLLQTGDNVVKSEAELAMRINRVIKNAEDHWDNNLQIITNTTAYDTCWIHKLLVEHSFQPLDTTRSGTHRWSYDVDSFALGSVGETPDTVIWRKLETFLKCMMHLPVDTAVHDHHPANDAKAIFAQFESIELFNAMVPMTFLNVITSSDEEYQARLEKHVTQICERANFVREIYKTLK